MSLREYDIMVSFDVVSLYTKIPVSEAISIIKEIIDEETTKMVKVCLASTYFSFRGDIYEKTHGMAMGSPLSLVIANIFMEHLKKMPSTPPTNQNNGDGMLTLKTSFGPMEKISSMNSSYT